MRMWVMAALWAAGAGAAMAAEPQVSMTVYNEDLALIEEVRTLDIVAGRQRLEFKDVSAAIRPETVALSAPGVTIIEQNFDYDLLSPDKLMEKAVGQQVKIVRTNPGTGQQVTETATVLAVNEGVVLKIGDRIEVLRDDGVPTRVIFDKVPENLRARPTLSVTVDSPTAGAREARLSYLSGGLSWKADYVALFDEKAQKLDLQGWITLTNKTGSTFTNAEARLVAGDVGQQQRSYGQSTQSYRPGTGGAASGREFSEYYIYPLPERTTIAQNQTKQIGFIEAEGVAARKTYEFRSEAFKTVPHAQQAKVAVDFSTAGEAGVGSELPAGTVRVYARDAGGDPKFIGEGAIGHTPRGADLSLKIGEAFDISVEQTLVAADKLGSKRTRYSMRYVLTNARDEPVVVKLRQYGVWFDSKVVKESHKSRQADVGTLEWDVPVPAEGETELTFTIEGDPTFSDDDDE